MTDWDKVYSASKESGNWYPDDKPLDAFDRISELVARFVGGLIGIALLAGVAGYLWGRLQ